MSFICDLLNQTVGPRVSAEMQPHLRAFYGGLIRRYLPQTWWFTTESGMATLVVDQTGVARACDGQAGQPDVSVSWTDRDAYNSLTAGDRRRVPPGASPPKVTIHTRKGQAAYDQLRNRLGL